MQSDSAVTFSTSLLLLRSLEGLAKIQEIEPVAATVLKGEK